MSNYKTNLALSFAQKLKHTEVCVGGKPTLDSKIGQDSKIEQSTRLVSLLAESNSHRDYAING